MKEYALGSGKFSTLVLMCTMVAAAFGSGGLIGRPAALYQNGMWLFLALLATPIGGCITSLVIPRLSKYYGCVSVAEVMGKMYGASVRRLVGILAFIYCLGILGAQLKALHWVMEQVFVRHALMATVIGVAIIILYSSMGGVSSFIKTEIIHFFIFIIIMPLVASYIIRASGGVTTITKYFHESNSMAFFHGGSVTAFISLTLLALLPNLEPGFFHRFLIGRDCKKNQAAAYAVAFVDLVNIMFIGCIAFIALAKFPSIEPQNTLLVVVQSFITAEWGIILFAIALLSMIISKAKYLVTTGAVLFVNDVITKKLAEKQKIKLLKVITILSAALALPVVCLFFNAFNTALLFTEYYLVIVYVPLIGGLFIEETRREHFFVSASAGFVTFSVLHLVYRNLNHEIFLMSTIVSLSVYLSVVFGFKKRPLRGATFSFYKLCDGVVAKHSIQTNNLSWIILLFFLLSMFFRGMSDGKETDTIIVSIEGMAGVLGFLLFCADKLSIKYKNTIILSIIWYCFAFAPVYVFLQQKIVSPFTINFIVSIVLLAGLFSWNVFLTLLLSGSSIAVVTFGILSRGFQDSIATVMYLFLFIGYMALVAYIAFRKKEQAVVESVKNQLAAEKIIEREKQEADMYNKIMRAVNISLDADNKYKNVLLNEDQTIMVSFADLKENILAYFQKVSIERKTKLEVVNSQHKVLNTGLPLSFFYKTIYSLILNVFYCNDTEDVRIKFGCDRSGKIRNIEISHGQYKINDRAKYLRGSYPQDILEWDVIKLLFEQLEIKITEGVKTLKVLFPSEATSIESKVISFETLRVRVAQETVS